MKPLLAPLVGLLVVTMAYGTLAFAPAPMASAPVVPADDLPQAPGPYRGPAAIPQDMYDAGWRTWGGGDDAADDDEFGQCGDVRLVFLNPDLQEDENGLVHAQGTFFIQFQAIAPADSNIEITRFSFSFGKSDQTLDNNPTLNCNESLPDNPVGKGTAGAYLLFYRSDFNSEDGFFVPIETRNVPDGEYAAAIHAYTGDNIAGYTEVGRGWTFAVVDNCVGQSIPNSCPNDSPQDLLSKDKTMPWPIVLPGDGIQTNGVNGLTIEFPEEMDKESVAAYLDGQPLPLTDWVPPMRDTDVVPLNDETACPAQIPYACLTKVYGPGFKWEGTIPDNGLLRVVGTDLGGNTVTKQIHLGSSVIGGTVSLQEPEIDFSVRSPDSHTLNAGDVHEFRMRLDNIGGAEAHVNLLLEFNETFLNARWTDVENDHGHVDKTHVVIPAGSQSDLNIEVETIGETPKGTYPIRAILEYPVAGQLVVKDRTLFLNVDSVITQDELNALENLTDEPKKVEDSPAVGPVVATGVLLALVGIARRRRAL